MKRYLPLAALLAFASGSAQAPPLAEPPGPHDLKIVETETLLPAPTRQSPQTLEGRLTMGAYTPMRKYATGHAPLLRDCQMYHLIVAPGARLKAQLKGSPRNFTLQFLSSNLGRTPDPGLNVNRINYRQDAAFYENRTEAPKTICCVVMGMDPTMADRPFTVVFTDY